MDGLENTRIYREIFDAVASVEGAEHPHRVRARQIGPMYSVVLDIEVDSSLNVAEAHRIAQQTERVLRERVENIYDVVVHIEPKGNVERSERYGVSEEAIRDPEDHPHGQ
jgi:divalent metal cation (Fe/Co/Zn/Cd) transporter